MNVIMKNTIDISNSLKLNDKNENEVQKSVCMQDENSDGGNIKQLEIL